MRNLQTDLEICEKVTPGPVRWHKLGSIYHLIGQYGPRPIILSTVTAKKENHWYPEMCISNLVDGLLEPLKPDHPDSVFIQESWEGWPESINRAIAAEAEVEKLRKEKERLMIVLNTINDIVSDSEGVAGWHLSGDIASWDSFGFMDAMQEVLKNGD